MVLVREHLDDEGRSPFGRWFQEPVPRTAARVATVLVRIGLGNFSNVKGVGNRVFECRLDFSSGYGIYFGKDGDTLVILLAGGTKRRRQRDIADAHAR